MEPQQQRLEKIISLLSTDPYFAISVTTPDGKFLCKDATGAALAEEHGGVLEFFNSIYDRNITQILLQVRRKNGNSFTSKGGAELMTFKPTEETPTQATNPTLPIQTQQAPAAPLQGLGLPGLNGDVTGLMAGMQGQMIYSYMDYPQVKAERDALKDKNETLKEKITELKEELLKKDFSEAKASGNKEMLNGLMETAGPILLQILAGRNGGGGLPMGGGELNAPAQGMPPAKQHLIQLVATMPDNLAPYLAAIVEPLQTEAFQNDFIALLQKHQLHE